MEAYAARWRLEHGRVTLERCPAEFSLFVRSEREPYERVQTPRGAVLFDGAQYRRRGHRPRLLAPCAPRSTKPQPNRPTARQASRGQRPDGPRSTRWRAMNVGAAFGPGTGDWQLSFDGCEVDACFVVDLLDARARQHVVELPEQQRLPHLDRRVVLHEPAFEVAHPLLERDERRVTAARMVHEIAADDREVRRRATSRPTTRSSRDGRCHSRTTRRPRRGALGWDRRRDCRLRTDKARTDPRSAHRRTAAGRATVTRAPSHPSHTNTGGSPDSAKDGRVIT